MKILFISSGNSESGISPIVKYQGESLFKKGIQIDYFTIKGKGFLGYLRSIPQIRIKLKGNKYDTVHAHYSYSALAASLAGAKPLVVSLMGSDIKSNSYIIFFIRLFNKFTFSKIIVKSEDMKVSLDIEKVSVIPNGVDINLFKPLNQEECKNLLNWDSNKKQILFAANPKRHEKNYELAQEAFYLIKNSDCELKFLDNVPDREMPTYYNAADVIFLTSLWEGSPNVIKEAMACNRPIVATNVGDISWLLNNISGCFITGFNSKEISDKLQLALAFSEITKMTMGNNRLLELALDSDSVAEKIVKLYRINHHKTKNELR